MSMRSNLVRQLKHLSLIWISPGELSEGAQDNNTKGSLMSHQTFQRRYSLRAQRPPVSQKLKANTHNTDPYTELNTHAWAR